DESRLYAATLVVDPGHDFALPFTYPPLAAVLFVLLAALPSVAATALFTGAGIAALVSTCLLAARRVRGPGRLALVSGLGAAAVAILLDPVRLTLLIGQINLVLMGLVAMDCLLARTRWPRGALIGLAAAIKLTPLVFVLFFLARRQWRPAATALGTFLGLGLLGAALAPRSSVEYWLSTVWQHDRAGSPAFHWNQSLRGALARLGSTGTHGSVLWLVLCLGILVLAWLAVARVRRAGHDLAALLLVAAAGLLVSPISWVYHWVWIAPALPLLAGLLRGHRSPTVVAGAGLAVAAFLTGPSMVIALSGADRDGAGWTWWQHIGGNTYVLIGVAVLLVAALPRHGTRPQPPGIPVTAEAGPAVGRGSGSLRR
ncbi:MAG TPA: glycosyltransferase 87 family protein, partial [Micromonospora sp.]